MPPLSDEGSGGCNTDPSASSGSGSGKPKDKNSISVAQGDSSVPQLPPPHLVSPADTNQP